MTAQNEQNLFRRHSGFAKSRENGLIPDIQRAQLLGRGFDNASKGHLFGRLCTALTEQPCKGEKWSTVDKAFACAWLNSQQAVVGTKCNKLLLLGTDGPSNSKLPPLQEIGLPQPATGVSRTQTQPDAFQNALWSAGTLLRSAQSNSRVGPGSEEVENSDLDSAASMIATAIANLDARSTAILGAGQFHVAQGGVQSGNCGIHCISLTPDRSMLACGGFAASDCQTFKIEEDSTGLASLTPSQTLVGHSDWIFGSAWVTDCHVVTGSRDKHLKLWAVEKESKAVNTIPLRSRLEENGKVRDVKYLEREQRVASLAINGTVQISDAHLDKISLVSTPYEREVVCMAASDSLLAVGSQNHVSLVDSRVKACVSSFANAEHNHGVRSLAFCHNVLSVGGGQGRIHFFDLRAKRYLDRPDALASTRSMSSHYLQTSEGHLARNNIYMEHFEGMEVKNACYAHAWDPTETKLLAVGGPLAFGLSGNYAATWS